MSGLQNFLALFSHLLFANRNLVIVLLCAGLFWVALDALIHRWRATRLESDLSTARSGSSHTMGRRYATTQAVEEAQAESGALPPVKGGRTYARNLGSALNKAGMSGPQIYSPPTPVGWTPNTNPGQPLPPQPGMTPPYATPNTPWAAPAQPAPAPWGYPAGAGRGMPGQPPTQAPYYQPPLPPQQPQSTGMPLPLTPQPQAPGLYAPPPLPAPFQQPAFPAPTSGPLAPSFSQTGAPAPAGSPLYQPPGPQPAGSEPSGQDSARRGKPKRRRFNFNVLENIEKIVQARPAEAPPSTGWTPPVTPPAPPLAPPAVPAPPAAPTRADATTPAKPAEAESLPLQFGPPAETPQAAAETEPEVAAETPATDEEVEQSQVTSQAEAVQPTAKAEPEEQLEPELKPEPEPKAEPTTSMRSMLFGEEASPSSAVKSAEPDATGTTEEPESSEAAWPSYSWKDSSSTESETAAAQPSATDETSGFDEPATETAAGEPAEADAEVPEAPVEADAGGPSAGTIVIIEDDQTAASYYATLFRGNGYTVEVANDGVSGVDLCARVQPQVILLDVMMPRQNGILVLQTLRASDETKNTPVVVMSNFSEPTLIKRALQLGALEYVIKTQVEGPALLNALPRWMNREKAFAAA